MPGLSTRNTGDEDPGCNVPLLKPVESADPDCVVADNVKGDVAGKVLLPGIAVAVCDVLSTLTNCTPLPTVTFEMIGEYPSARPAGVDCWPNAEMLTLIRVTLATLAPPPLVTRVPFGVQAASTIAQAAARANFIP